MKKRFSQSALATVLLLGSPLVYAQIGALSNATKASEQASGEQPLKARENAPAKRSTTTPESSIKDEFVFVGMADLTWAQNNVSGVGSHILSDTDSRYNGSGHWDGRVMFYLDGVMRGQKITAQLDTTESRLSDIFGKLDELDPRRFTRELNDDTHYPVYGDDSRVESKIDTKGKFYLKVENDNLQALWGNFDTQLNGTQYSKLNRKLYGAQLLHESQEKTAFGESRSFATAFSATGDTRGSHNEFAVTGGSLYFLKHQRVVSGSVNLVVEYRDSDTGRVKAEKALTQGIDFDIDHFQGRLMLSRPLSSSMEDGDSIISDSGLGGSDAWLVASYEYYSDGFDLAEQPSMGGRSSLWLNDHWRVGASAINEDNAQGEAYTLIGADMTLRLSENTYTNLEIASSTAGSGEIYVSGNGGLGFESVSLGENSRGKAWRIEQSIDFNDFSESELPLSLNAYYNLEEAGFSSFSLAREHELKEYGGELRYVLENQQGSIALGHSSEQELAQRSEQITHVQYQKHLADSLESTLELQQRSETNFAMGEKTRETLVAAQLEKSLFEGRDSASVTLQGTLAKDGDVENNNKVSVGYASQVNEKLKLGGELFSGNRGTGGALTADFDVTERATLYTKVENDLDSSSGRSITTTLGGKVAVSDKIDLYTERQFSHARDENSTNDVYGLSFKPSKHQQLDASYSRSDVDYGSSQYSDVYTNEDIERAIYTLGYQFNGDKLELRHRVEFRQEESSTEQLEQWVSTNRAKTRISEDLSWLAQFDIAKTTGDTDAEAQVVNDFVEAALGLAYRPQFSNAFNLFGKLTYISGLDPEAQGIANTNSEGTELTDDLYEQRSWVGELTGVYKFNAHFDTRFKVAHREGELRYRDESEWFSSGATLYAFGLGTHWSDYELRSDFRTLSTDLANDRKNGVVLSAYRYFGDNVKLGVGYNFTDYNDDLTRLNYRARGWFINLVGTY